MPTAPRRRLLTAAGWLVAIVISFPFVALLESLQLDGTDQAPGTPSMAQVTVGAFAIVPLPVLCGVILKRYDEAAKLRGTWHAKARWVPISASLTTGLALLAIFGRGWLGALAAVGATWQFVFMVALALRGAPKAVSLPARATTLADVMAMSERGQARAAMALLDRAVVAPGDQTTLIAVRAMCAYRAGDFEEAIGLHLQLAQAGAQLPADCNVAVADARLAAALRDGRSLPREELAKCTAAISSPSVAQETSAAYAHSKALLTLASGDPETAWHAGVAIVADRSITPADRAQVTAMIAIAAARAGRADVAGLWALKVPDWCPLRPAVERELRVRTLDSVDGAGDEDCVFAD